MSYRSNVPISEPNKKIDPKFGTGTKMMGGFGFHATHGLYIPVPEEEDQIEEPYPSSLIGKKIPNV